VKTTKTKILGIISGLAVVAVSSVALYGAGAVSQTDTTKVTVSIAPVLSMVVTGNADVSGEKILNVSKDETDGELAPGAAAFASGTVTVTTNDMSGYTTYITAVEGGDTELKHSSASDSFTTGGSTAGVNGLAKGTWGWAKGEISANSGTLYALNEYGVTNTGTPIFNTTSAAAPNGESTNFYIGVRAKDNQMAGVYTGKVLFTSVCNSALSQYEW